MGSTLSPLLRHKADHCRGQVLNIDFTCRLSRNVSILEEVNRGKIMDFGQYFVDNKKEERFINSPSLNCSI